MTFRLTRVFWKPPTTSGWGTIFVARLDSRRVVLATHRRPSLGPSRRARPARVVHAFASDAKRRETFDDACERKLARGWIEVRANLAAQGFGPPSFHHGLLKRRELLELIETARFTSESPRAHPRTVAIAEVALAKLPGARLVSAGTLRLSTGKLVATDPHHLDAAPVFTVPPGEYPVVLTVLDRRVLAASLVIHRALPTRWTRATEMAVDVGCAAFMDEAVVGVLELDDRGFLGAVGRTRGPRATIRSFGRAGNAIAFPTEQGDGSYGVWIGRRGRAVVRVTLDFHRAT